MQKLFVTGTDTEVGKTFVGCRLVQALFANGYTVQPYKPIESGCKVFADQSQQHELSESGQHVPQMLVPAELDPAELDRAELGPGELIPSDGLAYYQACLGATALTTNLATITPYRFQPAISPARAAQLAQQPTTIQQLLASLPAAACDILLIEGAGGFYSPLTSDGCLNADLAKALQTQVILVVRDQLGCLNHTLLTLAAIQQAGLTTIAIVLNLFNNDFDQVNQTPQAEMNNATELAEHTTLPIVQTQTPDWPNQLAELVACQSVAAKPVTQA